jgi:hypothetical protein
LPGSGGTGSLDRQKIKRHMVMNTQSKRHILSFIVVAVIASGIGYAFIAIHRYFSGPYYVVSGAGSPTVNGRYHVMKPAPTQGFWGGKEGVVCINEKGTAYLGINQECYIWANDHSANPAGAQSLYMIYSKNPTDGPWSVNAGNSPAPTVTYHP